MTDLTKIVTTGPSGQRVDIVFVAEGYQASERAKFLFDAQLYTDYMFSASSNLSRLNSPFSVYEKMFNVSALFVPSAQSGIDQPNKSIYVDTYFNSTQYGADGRLTYGDQAKLSSLLNQELKASEREISVVLMNSPVYGGAGGKSAWVTTGNISSAETMLHEIGHSFAGLQDEYADPALVNTFLLSSLDGKNVTNSLSNIPWRAWLGYQDELGTVGIYEGGYYRSNGVWRATQDSKMLHLGKPFNAPQKEAFVLAFYKSLGDYLNIYSDIPGLLVAGVPDANLLSFSWELNGQARGDNKLLFDAYGLGAYKNDNVVTLTTTDKSGYVRTGLEQTQQTETIKLKGVNLNDIAQKTYVLDKSGTLLRLDAQDNEIRLTAGAKNNYIDGGKGIDTLVVSSTSGEFELSKMSSGASVFMQQGKAVMAAINVEKVQFTDKTLWIGDAPPTNAITTFGTERNDIFRATTGNDSFDGGDGIDTVFFTGKRASFSVSLVDGGKFLVSSDQGVDSLYNVERLKFDDGAIGLDVKGVGGQAYRLYQAAFDRVPDQGGLGYWIDFLDRGGRLVDAAAGFVVSPEFQAIYSGQTGTNELVTHFYQNVLHRKPEAQGLSYWVNQLDANIQTVPMVLLNFSESPENQANLTGVMSNGFNYLAMI